MLKNQPYDVNKDFVPVTLLAKVPNVFVIHPDVPAKNFKEFVAYAKANPGQLNYGSAGNGGSSHLVPEMFKSATGLFMVHIPYRGSAPAFIDLMAGQVQFMAESIPQAAQYHKQGKVRALAVTSRERNPALPDIPTVMETGIANFEVVGFYGFLAPAGTPKDVVNKLSDAFKADTVQASDYAQAVCDFANALGLDRFVLTGNSFGSAVAQAFAIHHPERVRALVQRRPR
jgi:tripartite-type tricarboxylate transporter receptor subunit TctC